MCSGLETHTRFLFLLNQETWLCYELAFVQKNQQPEQQVAFHREWSNVGGRKPGKVGEL